MPRHTLIPFALVALLGSAALAQDVNDPLWHLDAPSLETILRDGTRDGGDTFRKPGFETRSVPINAPQVDTPAPGGALIAMLAGLRCATTRRRP